MSLSRFGGSHFVTAGNTSNHPNASRRERFRISLAINMGTLEQILAAAIVQCVAVSSESRNPGGIEIAGYFGDCVAIFAHPDEPVPADCELLLSQRYGLLARVHTLTPDKSTGSGLADSIPAAPQEAVIQLSRDFPDIVKRSFSIAIDRRLVFLRVTDPFFFSSFR